MGYISVVEAIDRKLTEAWWRQLTKNFGSSSMVHKELQDTISQLEAIRHEIRTISFMNPGPLTRRLVDSPDQTSASGNTELQKPDTLNRSTITDAKNYNSTTSRFSDMHSQAMAYAKLAESTSLNSGPVKNPEVIDELTDESGLFTILPVSAESTGLLPDRSDNAKGSDIVLEAILEAEVARNAKEFFAQHQNQIKNE
ncbi:hypothetical protein U1Q18_034049 [Sarracenia purpurea var. burkii]